MILDPLALDIIDSLRTHFQGFMHSMIMSISIYTLSPFRIDLSQ
jgi:hypothetical protein